MKSFSTSAVTAKPAENVLQAALVILSNVGFAIVKRDENTAELTGPGLNITKQNPLLGASSIHLKVNDDHLYLAAELEGVETMRKFLIRFPFMLGLGLGLMFGVVGGILFGRLFGVGFGVPWAQGWTWLLVTICGSMLPVAPWLFLAPMISRMIRTRTQNALATLVQNSIQLAKAA